MKQHRILYGLFAILLSLLALGANLYFLWKQWDIMIPADCCYERLDRCLRHTAHRQQMDHASYFFINQLQKVR